MLVRMLRQQWIGVLGVMIGLSGVAFAATGQPAILGRLNRADRVTTFQNSSGPAAAFNGAPGAPPFTVGSNVVVPKLNASRLGGRAANAFARAGTSYSKAESDARYAADGVLEFAVLLDDVVDVAMDTSLFRDSFAPNVPGTFTLRVFGQCRSVGASGRLWLYVGPSSRSTPIDAPACENSLSTHLGVGDGVDLDVRVRPNTSSEIVDFAGGVAVVTFVPD
jgi:hypothetical protein